MTPDELRGLIREGLPDGIRKLMEIIASDKTSAGNKIKAFATLADRGGIPEIKATITQQVTAKLTIDEMREQRDSLLQEQDSIGVELKKLKAGGVEDARTRQEAVLPRPLEQEGTTG